MKNVNRDIMSIAIAKNALLDNIMELADREVDGTLTCKCRIVFSLLRLTVCGIFQLIIHYCGLARGQFMQFELLKCPSIQPRQYGVHQDRRTVHVMVRYGLPRGERGPFYQTPLCGEGCHRSGSRAHRERRKGHREERGTPCFLVSRVLGANIRFSTTVSPVSTLFHVLKLDTDKPLPFQRTSEVVRAYSAIGRA